MSTSGVIEITMAAMGPPGEAYGEVGGDFEGFLPNPSIKSGAVTTAKLADGAVTDAKITSVSSGKVTGLADSLAAKQDVIPDETYADYSDPRLSDQRVPTNGSVSTAKIADGAVTDGKIDSVGVAKVTGLSALLAGHATDAELAAEINRAIVAESAIDDRVDDEVATRIANDNTLNGYVVAETARAQTAEGTIAASVETERLARINDVDAVQGDLSSETSRAMTAEAAVQASVNAEATRAQAAEGVLDEAIDDEVSDRAAAVAAAQAFAIQRSNHTGVQPIGTVTGLQTALDDRALQTALDAEITRATAAETTKLAKTSNLNDLASAETARGNLGLGTAATQNSGAFDSAGAAAAAQAHAVQRGNHTGVQPQNTVQNLVTDLSAKASQAGLDAEVTARTNADALKADLVAGKVPVAQLPSVTISDFLGEIASEAAMVALVGQRGDWAIRTDLFASFILIADDPTQVISWKRLPTPADLVSSVNGRTGVVTGLAEQTALQSEIDRAVAGESAAVASAIQRANHTGVQAIGTVTGLQGALDAKATANDLTLEIARAVAAEDALETDVQGMQTDLANLDAELVTETANRIADVDAAQAYAAARGNHTGVQAISTVSGLQGALDAQTTGLTDEATARVAGDALAVKKAANLSDLANFATSRANLGLGDSVITVTGNYAMSSPDGTVLANAAGAAIEVTLPAHSAGRVVRVEKIDASLNQVTVTPTAGTVDGAANKVLKVRWEGRTFQSDGTNWFTVARTELTSVADVAADLALEQTTRATADDALDAAVDAEVAARTAADLAIIDTTDDLRADLTDETAARVAGLSGKQPLDSDLTAIAALSTTAFGRDLLALADGTEFAGLIPNGTYEEVANVPTDVARLATGGSGTVGSPWTGWETAFQALPVDSRINFRKGYYRQGTTFMSGRAGWKVTGPGATITLADGVSLAAAMLLFTNCLGVEVSDITFNVNKAGTPAVGGDLNQAGLYFYAQNAAGITAKVRNVTVLNGHDYGIVGYSAAPGTNRLEMDVADSKASGCDLSGIYMKGLTKGSFVNCTSGGNGVSGISIDASSNFTVIGGQYNDNGWQGVTCSASAGCTDFSLIGVTTNDNDTVDQGGGIVLSIGSARFRVVGCTALRNYFYGMSVDPRAEASDAMVRTDGTITGCVFGDSTRAVSGHGINVNYATHITITGNTLFGNPGSGLALSGGNCTAEGNILRGNGVAGISVNYDGTSIPAMGAHTIGVNHYDGNGLTVTGNGAALTTTKWLGNERPAGVAWIESSGFRGFVSSFSDIQNPTSGGLVHTATNEAIVMKHTPWRRLVVTKLVWFTGSVSSGNYDWAIFDYAGTLLWSKGSTAWPSTATAVTETVSGVTLLPGVPIYVVFAADTTAGTWKGIQTIHGEQMMDTAGVSLAKRFSAAFPITGGLTVLTAGAAAGTKLPQWFLRSA